MNITLETIDELAHLARLKFDEQDKSKIKADLDRILVFCMQLNKVDTEGVEPLIYLSDRVNNLREDVVVSDISQEEALHNAPHADSDYFKVAKVINK